MVRSFKLKHRAQGTDHCAVCEWRPPRFPTLMHRRPSRVPGLHVHHIIPWAKGGSDEHDNLVILCPNHHNVAHNCHPLWVSPDDRWKITRDELIRYLKLADQYPDTWLDMVAKSGDSLVGMGF